MRKLEKMAETLNNDFKHQLAEAMREKYEGMEVSTHFDFLGSGQYVSVREDGEDFTPEQHAFLAGFSEGYGKALVRAVDAGVVS